MYFKHNIKTCVIRSNVQEGGIERVIQGEIYFEINDLFAIFGYLDQISDAKMHDYESIDIARSFDAISKYVYVLLNHSNVIKTS